MTTEIGPIQRGEIKQVVFDFSINEMEADETIDGTPTIGVYMKYGVDVNKDDIVVDGPTVDGQKVIWRVAYQKPKVTYYLQCTVVGSTRLSHTLTGILPSQAVA